MANRGFNEQGVLSVLVLLGICLAPGALGCSCLFTPLKDLSCADFELVIVGTVTSSPSAGTPSPVFSPFPSDDDAQLVDDLKIDDTLVNPNPFPFTLTFSGGSLWCAQRYVVWGRS